MLKLRDCLWVIGLLLTSSIVCEAQTVTVDAKASIFGAGYAGTSADGTGAAPTSVDVQGLSAITFPNVTGFVTPGASGPIDIGPDGYPADLIVNMNSWGGISGMIDGDGRVSTLCGVFTNGPIPFGQAAPARLNVTGSFKNQASFAPLLNQTFFIGDGLTGTGAGQLQSFSVPPGATHLFLGFLDGFAFAGNPQFYHDNRGSLTVEVSAAHEAPANVQATQFGVNGTKVLLTWNYGDDPVDGFNIQSQLPSSGTGNWPSLTTVSVASACIPSTIAAYTWACSYIDDNVPPFFTASYRMNAYQGSTANASAASNIATAYQLKKCTRGSACKDFNGDGTSIQADFTPDSTLNSIHAAALALPPESTIKFDHFNWIQYIEHYPQCYLDAPPLHFALAGALPRQGAPVTAVPQVDPPIGGYYEYFYSGKGLSDQLPFLFNEEKAWYLNRNISLPPSTDIAGFTAGGEQSQAGTTTATFYDKASVSCLTGNPPDYLSFLTLLVGVTTPVGAVIPSFKLLNGFVWSTTYNQLTGETSLSSVKPPIDGGVGGVFNVVDVDLNSLPLNVRQQLIQFGATNVSIAPKIDKDAPSTAAFFSGLHGTNESFSGSVLVTLIATDIDGPSDIAATSYIVDGSPAHDYVAPFTVSGDGKHSIQFRSVDLAGNTETPPASQTFIIDATPPSISCTANTTTLWPPNGKQVRVTISGNATDPTSGVDMASATFRVTDEYSEVEPKGNVAIGPGGNYSFGVSLVADRNGKDKDGRKYIVEVSGKDQAGNVGSCSTAVTVPHDQGK